VIWAIGFSGNLELRTQESELKKRLKTKHITENTEEQRGAEAKQKTGSRTQN